MINFNHKIDRCYEAIDILLNHFLISEEKVIESLKVDLTNLHDEFIYRPILRLNGSGITSKYDDVSGYIDDDVQAMISQLVWPHTIYEKYIEDLNFENAANEIPIVGSLHLNKEMKLQKYTVGSRFCSLVTSMKGLEDHKPDLSRWELLLKDCDYIKEQRWYNILLNRLASLCKEFRYAMIYQSRREKRENCH